MKITEQQLPNIRQGVSVWKKYARLYPNSRDELYAEMLFAVHYANLNLEKNEREGHPQENPEAYVRITVKGAISQYISKLRVFGVSRNTFEKKGGKIRQREYVELDIEDVNAQSTIEIEEVLETCFTSEREREIVDLVRSGWIEEDIAARYGVKRQRINQVLMKFREKLECKLTS